MELNSLHQDLMKMSRLCHVEINLYNVNISLTPDIAQCSVSERFTQGYFIVGLPSATLGQH